MNVRAAIVAVVVAGTIGLSSGAAGATPTVRRPTVVTTGNCIVATVGKLECFAKLSDFTARVSQLNSSPTTSCPVFLYSGANYTGQTLGIYVEGQWLNLSDYGFDNVTVSFVGNGCGFHLADYQWGGGSWYPGNTAAWAYSPNMGTAWVNRVSSVYVS